MVERKKVPSIKLKKKDLPGKIELPNKSFDGHFDCLRPELLVNLDFVDFPDVAYVVFDGAVGRELA